MAEKFNSEKLDRIVANAHAHRDKASRGYREKALKMYPWVCCRPAGCYRDRDRDDEQLAGTGFRG